jgi:hypothetical protein
MNERKNRESATIIIAEQYKSAGFESGSSLAYFTGVSLVAQ